MALQHRRFEHSSTCRAFVQHGCRTQAEGVCISMSFVAPPGVPSQPIRVPWAASKSGRILGSIFRTQKRPQKCEPQLNAQSIHSCFAMFWRVRLEQRRPCLQGAPLRAFVSAAGHVTRRAPRATASVCLPFFPCPPERPLCALLALLHVPFISLPCGMVPALSALSGGHEDLLHPVSNLGLQAWKTARLLPGKAPVCLGLRPECPERLGVHQRGSLARARHSA